MVEDEYSPQQPDLDDLIDRTKGQHAAQMSKPSATQAIEEQGEGFPVLRMRVGNTQFAIEGTQVREITGWTAPTPLPGAPGYLLGVIIHRRQVVGVLCLKRWFDLALGVNLSRGEAETVPHQSTVGSETRIGVGEPYARIVIIETPAFSVGIGVEAQTDLETWPEHANAESLPETVPDAMRNYLQGARFFDDSILFLLDIAKVLDDAAIR